MPFISKSELGKFQKIQNMAAKLVTKARKYDSSTEALKSLCTLAANSSPNRIRSPYIGLQGHSQTRTSLLILITINTARRSGLCSSSTAFTLVVPFTKRKTFAAFSICRPKTWNALPDYLCRLTDYALSMDWETLPFLHLFPSSPILPMVLQKVKQSGNTHLVIAPL